MRSSVLLLAHVAGLFAVRLPAQVVRTGERAGVEISGVVFDSLAGAPLQDAVVQLVSMDSGRAVVRTARSAANGTYILRDVPRGRFTIGFLHPVLDSLGVDSPALEVTVGSSAPITLHLALPPGRRIRAASCIGTPGDDGAVHVGVARSAGDRSPSAGVVIDAAWLEYDLRRGVITHRVGWTRDTTDSHGRFKLCNVPRGGTMLVRAMGLGDSSALLELELPRAGFLQRDVYLGWAGRAATADSGAAAFERGDGVLRGRVVDRETGRPIPGARIGLLGGEEVRSGDSGAWSLSAIASGTRVLEVRAVGFSPQKLPVDVIADAAPVEVRLFSVGAILDTVRVTASRIRLENTGFEARARRGVGRFVTTADLLRRPVIFTSQVFHTMPGMRVDRTPRGESRITMRGIFASRCSPAIYVDGHPMRGLSAEDLDSFVTPDEVAGIEVYGGSFVPAEFQDGLSGCGVIVVWRKAGENPARRWSYRRRTLHGIGAVALGVGIGLLMAR